mgnify:CR=1 FL=1|jgi:Protein of unknown function (DUF2975)
MTQKRRVTLVGVLKRALDVIWYLLWAALVVGSAAMALVVIVFILQFFGATPLASVLERLDSVKILSFPLFVAEIVTLLVLVDRLRRMFATLLAGDPFVPENAGHLRVIAIAIAVYQAVRYIAQAMVAFSLTLFGHPTANGTEVSVEYNINLGAWFAVVALLVLSEVFREGARMRQEQKLTI